MERKHRLTRSIDFKRVRRTGRSLAHPLAVLVYLPNDRGTTRIGISAARSLGNAVQRNRAKRRLREALRECLPEIAGGWDIVVIARPEIVDTEWPHVRNAIRKLLKQSKMLIEEN
jgi:ribonuclease P protein component